MKKALYILSLAALMVTGCYDKDIAALREELDSVKNNEIAPLEQQVEKIKSSVSDLDKLSKQLDEYMEDLEKISEELQGSIAKVNAKLEEMKTSISGQLSESEAALIDEMETLRDALQARLDAVNAALEELTKTEASLSERVENLRNHAEETYASKDWIEGTFATLESQQEIAEEMATIKAYASELTASLDKAKAAIQDYLDSTIADLSGKVSANLKAQAEELTKMVDNAIDNAYTGLRTAYEQKLSDAIKTSEDGVKSWVADTLSAYFTIAEAEAKIAAFNKIVGNVPEGKSIQQEIDSLGADLEAMKVAVKEGYEAAIKTAIETSYNNIATLTDEKIAELNETVAGLAGRVATLESRVNEFVGKLDALKERVNKLDVQRDSIQTSVAELEDLYNALKEYVLATEKQLKQTDTANYNALKALIDDLQNFADNDLLKKIEDLKAYVGTLPAGTDSTTVIGWIQGTVKTYQEQFKIYCTIAYADSVSADIRKALKADSTALAAVSVRLDSIINVSETTVKGWISTKLSSYFEGCDTAYVNREFRQLEADLLKALSDGDAATEQKISDLRDKIDKAVSDLNTEIENAIRDMISNNDGYVTSTIKEAIEARQKDILDLKSKVSELEGQVAEIKKQVTEMEKTIAGMRAEVDSLRAFVADMGFETLGDMVNYVDSVLSTCPTRFATIDSLNFYLVLFYGEGGTRENPKEGSIQYWFNQLEDLAKRLGEAETSLGYIEKFLKDYMSEGGQYSTTLDDLLKALWSQISELDNELNSEGGVLYGIDALYEALYGEGGTKEEPKEGSVWYRLQELQKNVATSCFSSVAWLPYDGSGYADWNKLAFVVRPAGLAPILAQSGSCSIIYVKTVTRATTPDVTEWKVTDMFTGTEDGILRLTSSAAADAPVFGPYSIALKVEHDNISFTSNFIPLKPLN